MEASFPPNVARMFKHQIGYVQRTIQFIFAVVKKFQVSEFVFEETACL